MSGCEGRRRCNTVVPVDVDQAQDRMHIKRQCSFSVQEVCHCICVCMGERILHGCPHYPLVRQKTLLVSTVESCGSVLEPRELAGEYLMIEPRRCQTLPERATVHEVSSLWPYQLQWNVLESWVLQARWKTKGGALTLQTGHRKVGC